MPDGRNVITQVVSGVGVWNGVVRDDDRKPITGFYTADDVLDARVWAGDDQSVLLSPGVAWTEPAAGTYRLTVTSAALSTAGITSGLYEIETGVTSVSDGQRRVAHRGVIRFLPSAGSAVAPTVFCSAEDLYTYCREIGSLQSADVDQTGFAEQRHRALAWFNDRVLARYRPRPGCSRREVDGAAAAAGAFDRFAPPSPAADAPTRTQLAGWLVPGRLSLNAAVVEANARYAASLVYGATPGGANVYQQMSVTEKGMAEASLDRARVEVDAKSTPDGTPTLRIHRDVTYLT